LDAVAFLVSMAVPPALEIEAARALVRMQTVRSRTVAASEAEASRVVREMLADGADNTLCAYLLRITATIHDEDLQLRVLRHMLSVFNDVGQRLLDSSTAKWLASPGLSSPIVAVRVWRARAWRGRR
jgi:hypothetical protein